MEVGEIIVISSLFLNLNSPKAEGGSKSRTERLEDAWDALDSVLWVHLNLLLSFGISKGRSLKSTLVALPEVVASCCMSNLLRRSFGISKGKSDNSASLSTLLRLRLSTCGLGTWNPKGLHLIPALDSIEIPLSDPCISVSPDEDDCSAKLMRFLFCGTLRFLKDVSVGVVAFVFVFVTVVRFSVTSSGDAFCELLLRLLSEVSEAGSWEDLSEMGERI